MPSSGRSYSPTSYDRKQAELEEIIRVEVGDQTYEFHEDVVARMLSPKLPKHNATLDPYPSLDNFDCLIDHLAVQTAIATIPPSSFSCWVRSEETNYLSMIDFLNKCVDQCDEIYDVVHQNLPPDDHFKVVERSQRWFPELRFIKGDKLAVDPTQNSSGTMPDIVGMNDSQAATYKRETVHFWWCMPHEAQYQEGDTTHHNLQISIPVEMKNSWSEMAWQSGTYARSQVCISPLRGFAPVIAINHKQGNFRFLIFHPGGLSASKELKFDETGSQAFKKMLLSILLWQCAEDAGHPSFTDGQKFCIPEGITDNCVWTTKPPIRHALSVRGRNTFVVGLSLSDSETNQDSVVKELYHPERIRYKSATAGFPPIPPSSSFHQSPKKPEKHIFGSAEMQAKVINPLKRSADQAKLDLISNAEKKPRPLTSVISSFIPPKIDSPSQSSLVVKCSWPNPRREAVEPNMYAACPNAFGLPRFLGSYVPSFRDGHPMCNSIFLPKKEEIEQHYWPIFYRGEKPPPIPKDVDCRRLVITVLADEGRNLDKCDNAEDLRNCLLHSMLGWLSIYQNGYMHRDISIGNLLKLVEPLLCEPFNTLGFIKLVASSDELCELDLNDESAVTHFISGKHPEYQELLMVALQLKNTLSQFELKGKCKAVVIDGDLAAYIPTYFDSGHDDGTFSGTVEFMSTDLLLAIRSNKPALHSPLDDLWSFFWTALWETLDNCHEPKRSAKEEIWRADLRVSGPTREFVAIELELNPDIETRTEYSYILRQMAPLLREWYGALKTMTLWTKGLKRDGDGAKESILFHKLAYLGVLDFVKIASKYRST